MHLEKSVICEPNPQSHVNGANVLYTKPQIINELNMNGFVRPFARRMKVIRSSNLFFIDAFMTLHNQATITIHRPSN